MIAPTRRQSAARKAIRRFLADNAGTPGKSPTDWQGRCIDMQTSSVGWPIRRAQLAAELTARVDGKNIPNQLETSYCGPAAFLYCLLHDRPDLYVAYAIGLWQHGHYDFASGKTHMDVAGMRGMATEMRKLDAARKANPKIGRVSNLDWMTMASLSASTRPLRSIWGAPEPSAQAASVTYPQVLKGWFAAVGSRPVASSMVLGALKSNLSSFLEIAPLVQLLDRDADRRQPAQQHAKTSLVAGIGGDGPAPYAACPPRRGRAGGADGRGCGGHLEGAGGGIRAVFSRAESSGIHTVTVF